MPAARTRADHHLGVTRENRRDEGIELPRVVAVVAIEEYDDLRWVLGEMGQGFQTGRAVSALGFVDDVLVSRPYIDVTLSMMRAFGARASWHGEGLRVSARCPYRPGIYPIEPDAQSAVYGFAAAAIAGGRMLFRRAGS